MTYLYADFSAGLAHRQRTDSGPDSNSHAVSSFLKSRSMKCSVILSL